MSKKISLFWIPICVVLAAVLSFDIAYFAVSSKYSDAVDKAVAKEKEKYSYGNLRSIEQLVEENFDGKVDEKKLSDSLIRGYIGGLDDKYSVYMTSDEYREYIETWVHEIKTLIALTKLIAESSEGRRKAIIINEAKKLKDMWNKLYIILEVQM